MKKSFIIPLLVVFQMATLSAQNLFDSLDLELNNIINKSDIPGLGVSIISENGVLYSNGFGYRDIGGKLLYDSLTVQPVASISKTVIAVALMKLVEEGKLNLDENINTYLPFKIINPNFPDDKITLLQLATHTSSILETDDTDDGAYYIIERNARKNIFPKGYYKYYKKYLNNENLSLKKYLESYLSVKGNNFKENIYGKYKPGNQYFYSNIGAALVAYIIEIVSGQSFEEYTKTVIFDPLDMKNTSWKRSNSSNSSCLYFHNKCKAPDYSLLNFPAGNMYTNSCDIGKFMTDALNGYNGKGKLLNKNSYQYMMNNRITAKGIDKTNGIFWQIIHGENIGHDGGEIGVACKLVFSPKLNKAFFMTINMSVYDQEKLEKDFIDILIALSKYTKKLE